LVVNFTFVYLTHSGKSQGAANPENSAGKQITLGATSPANAPFTFVSFSFLPSAHFSECSSREEQEDPPFRVFFRRRIGGPIPPNAIRGLFRRRVRGPILPNIHQEMNVRIHFS